ncbi:hypothetical protein NBRC111894_558 [Sporolactobacillus inulinus]|uniref:Uncharacterized protein n=1 Tax=Sporolactobacillus inulinus TaxID=2078 RepID=A0A4Y1Z7M6_9BACL|nr:hypothetical protein NBRC111894_558 [Sporolactobacillus inulinus]
MGSCLFGAESSLRLLAGTHQQRAIPQAPEYLRFDSRPRHWANFLILLESLALPSL